MLALEPSRVFWGGLGIIAAGVSADSAVHLAGWVAAEGPVHWSLLVGMLVALAGVLLRAMSPRFEREASHAHR